uniref:Ionotropic glutamate receptor L-glutamate and glycine-binding domain-containing protein n=1 Tax=Plectus sambesii TaxID=2011161 RepID=A0A914X843_9BILA
MSQKPVTPLRPIRIATAAYPPFVNDCGIYTLIRTDECPQPGVDHEILGQLFAYAKIPYELYPHTGDVNWGEVQPDGSYDGLIGDVINGKFDTIGAQYALTEIRTTKVDFSYNIHHETAMYLVSNAPNPDEEWIGQATLIYRVFDWQSTVPADFDAIAWQGFIFRNGSAWKPIFSRNMIMISDFVTAAYERYRNGSDACDDFSQPPATPLPIMSLLSVFLLPVCGGLVGFIMFCYELAKYRRTKRNVKYILPLTAGEFDIMMFPS